MSNGIEFSEFSVSHIMTGLMAAGKLHHEPPQGADSPQVSEEDLVMITARPHTTDHRLPASSV
ncbi:MAG: hypothetical protein M1837_003202 [Sclerophora amabilis]|nr:MAG: hypothetical protein M1837_003202 [Sclerophora amabilis]